MPHRPPVAYQENFSGCSVTPEEFAFLKAIERYQRENRRRYPSFREVLFVLHALGYRKVGRADAPEFEVLFPLEAALAESAAPTPSETPP